MDMNNLLTIQGRIEKSWGLINENWIIQFIELDYSIYGRDSWGHITYNAQILKLSYTKYLFLLEMSQMAGSEA